MKNGFRYIGILLLSALLLFSCSINKRVRKADARYEMGEYDMALKKYRRVYTRLPRNKRRVKARIANNMAESYRRLGQYARAERSYRAALRYGYMDSIIYIHQAQMQMNIAHYKDAEKTYLLALEQDPSSTVAMQGLKTSKEIKTWQAYKTRYKVKPAKDIVSRRSSDFSLVYTDEDGSGVLFTSNRSEDNNTDKSLITGDRTNNIFSARQNSSQEWEDPILVEGEINSEADEGVPTVDKEGKTMVFSRCQSDYPAGELYVSKRAGGAWASPQKLKLFPDSTITCGQPALSPDGSVLYFVSDAPGGEGGNDIWYVEKTTGVNWGVPINMGPEINTSGTEAFPYMRGDSTFFFSSDTRPGFGGLDIFKARQDSLGTWTVDNMLRPINSAWDDFGLCYKGKTNEGYFSSSRNQRKMKDRLYTFVLPAMVYEIVGMVKDETGEVLAGATIRLVGNHGENVKIPSKKDGTYSVELNRGSKYVMMASARGCLNGSFRFDTFGLLDSKTYEKDFVLPTVGKAIRVDNIFFDLGQWTLTNNSAEALNGLIKRLNDNPNIAIEISAYTDSQGNEDFNQNLSEKRAKSVVDYLIKAGIAKGRLTSVGYGETKPVVVDEALAKQYKFLKKDQVLNDTFIESLPQDKQDICNQINRRTQFQVTKTTYNLY